MVKVVSKSLCDNIYQWFDEQIIHISLCQGYYQLKDSGCTYDVYK